MGTRKELERANLDAAWWDQFAKNGWKLYGWTDRNRATFHHEGKRFVEVSRDTIECLGLSEQIPV